MHVLYDFECMRCKTVYEAMTKRGTYTTPTPCPKCGGAGLRIVSGFGGYGIRGNNTASVRPKTAGYKAPKKSKTS